MVVGVLQAELSIPGAASLKDKRRVVRSLKDRLHREHQVSVAEVAAHDRLNLAVLGITLASAEGRRAGEVLDAVEGKLRKLLDAELVSIQREILDGGAVLVGEGSVGDPDLDREMLAYGLEEQSGNPPAARGEDLL